MAQPDDGRHPGASRSGAGRDTIPVQTRGSGHPDSPLELGGTGWRHVLKRSAREFVADRCPMTAASLAYHWFLALFPALIALLGLVSLMHLGAGTGGARSTRSAIAR
jgi:membrane protein